MSKIFFCWELGDDLGHLGQLHPITHQLLNKNDDIYIAVKDLSKIRNFNWDKRIKFLQAPIWLSRLRKPIKNRSYAEILIYKGYHSPSTLRTLVEGWINLFELVKADIIIFDHSPTALLASSSLKTPRVILSNPFLVPPIGSSPKNIRPWEDSDQIAMEENERYIVNVINKVAENFKIPNIHFVSDLFNVEKTILAGIKELDFYQEDRIGVIYKNSILAAAGMKEPEWGSTATPKIFAYLKYGNEQADLILSLLSSLKANVVCYYADAKPENYEKYCSEAMRISNTPFDLTAVYKEADIIVCHGGIGMVHSALRFGCPLVLLPLQLEQQNTAYILDKMKIAVTISKDTTMVEAIHHLHKLFNSPIYFENVKIFSEMMRGSDALSTVEEICVEIKSLIC